MAFHNDHVYMNFRIKLIRDSRMQSKEKIMWLLITKFHLLVLSLSLWLTLRSRHCYCLVCDILVVWPYTIKFALQSVQVSCFYYIPMVVQLLPLIPEHLISPVRNYVPVTPFFPPPSLWQPLIYLSLCICLVWAFHVSGLMQ